MHAWDGLSNLFNCLHQTWNTSIPSTQLEVDKYFYNKSSGQIPIFHNSNICFSWFYTLYCQYQQIYGIDLLVFLLFSRSCAICTRRKEAWPVKRLSALPLLSFHSCGLSPLYSSHLSFLNISPISHAFFPQFLFSGFLSLNLSFLPSYSLRPLSAARLANSNHKSFPLAEYHPCHSSSFVIIAGNIVIKVSVNRGIIQRLLWVLRQKEYQAKPYICIKIIISSSIVMNHDDDNENHHCHQVVILTYGECGLGGCVLSGPSRDHRDILFIPKHVHYHQHH